jgi:hypothetical protein
MRRHGPAGSTVGQAALVRVELCVPAVVGPGCVASVKAELRSPNNHLEAATEGWGQFDHGAFRLEPGNR